MKALTLAVLLALSTSAYAGNNSGGDTCNGSGSCGSTSPTSNNSTANAGAIGVGVGIAGASSNATSTNTNLNSNLNSNTNKNEVNSSNVQGQLQGQAQKTENSNNSSTSVNVEGSTYNEARNAVSTAFAPSIPATATCALSVSAGVSVIGFSGSFGKAYIDENCVALEKVRTVSLVLGDKETAMAMMCLDKTYAKARANTGNPCQIEQD